MEPYQIKSHPELTTDWSTLPLNTIRIHPQKRGKNLQFSRMPSHDSNSTYEMNIRWKYHKINFKLLLLRYCFFLWIYHNFTLYCFLTWFLWASFCHGLYQEYSEPAFFCELYCEQRPGFFYWFNRKKHNDSRQWMHEDIRQTMISQWHSLRRDPEAHAIMIENSRMLRLTAFTQTLWAAE